MADRVAFVLFALVLCGGLGAFTLALLAVAVSLFRRRH